MARLLEDAVYDTRSNIIMFDRTTKEEREYWIEKLSSGAGDSNLKLDYLRPAVYSGNGETFELSLDPALYRRICRLTNDGPFLIYTTLLTAIKVCLHKYTGSPRIVVGSPSLMDDGGPVQAPNVVAILDEIDDRSSFRRLLMNVRQTLVDAYARQIYPFERIVKSLGLKIEENRCPVFDVVVLLTNIHCKPLRLRNDLTLSFTKNPSSIGVRVIYNPALFLRRTVEGFLNHSMNLLASALEEPNVAVGNLSMLSAVERLMLLEQWNETDRDYPSDTRIDRLVEDRAQAQPDGVAAVAGKARITYGELRARANRLANYLLRLGAGPEQCVGVCLERGFMWLAAMLGVMKAGAVYVPLDSAYPKERLILMIEDIAAVVIVTMRRFVSSLPSGARIVCLDGDECEQIAGESEDEPSGDVISDNLAYIIYTSGSTGRPKGVCISHEMAVNHFSNFGREFGLTAQDRVLQYAALNFDVSLEQTLPSLVHGATVILPAPDGWSAVEAAHNMRDDGITVVNFPPAYWHQFVMGGGLDSGNMPRLMIVGGDVMLTQTLRLWQRGPAQGCRLVNAYGPTEATVTSTVFEVPPHISEDASLMRVPVGRPLPNRKIFILDKNREPTAVDVPGELHIGGGLVARGYLNSPELTAEKFTPDPFGGRQGSRLYNTGDLASYLGDGNIDFFGRIDHQVKLRGFRIELGEIESVLASHPAVTENVVVAREDDPGEKHLIAYVVPREKTGADCGGRSNARDRMEMWPSIGEYFVYDDLLYYVMSNDEAKIHKYNAAINRLVLDRTVVDVGTGKDALLARLCVEAGARMVYAIEFLEKSYKEAKELIRKKGLEGRITLIHGDSSKVELPEKVDICVSELFCSIGGAGGAAVLLNDARRFLSPGGRIIPRRALTRIAAVELPEEIEADVGFTDVSAHYVRKVFEQVGHRFDLRVCISNIRASSLVSTSAVFEDLDFEGLAACEFEREVVLSVTRDSRCHGFLVWLSLETIAGEEIDILEGEYGWMPVYLPVFDQAVHVSKGDIFRLTCSGVTSDDGIHPDYAVRGQLVRASGQRIELRVESFHHDPSYGKAAFYRRVFPGNEIVVSAGGGAELSPNALKSFLRKRLPDYMLPSTFVFLDKLPLTSTGKVNRAELPDPDCGRPESVAAIAAPRTPSEDILSGIWAEVLKLEQVGIDDNFFHFGGHSLKATQAISRVREAFQVDLPLRTIFESPTVAALAVKVEEALRASRKLQAPPLVAAPRDKSIPLSFAQQRLWFLDRLEPASPFYNISMAVRLEGRLDAAALERSLNEVINRHETLRTVFSVDDGAPVQVVLAEAAVRLEPTNLGSLQAAEQDKAVALVVDREAKEPFDLAHGPLVRARLLMLNEHEHVLVFTMHHIVSDGWSMGVLIREVTTLYEADLGGRQITLPPLPVQYADFAIWQRGWLSWAMLDVQLDYWKRQLTDMPALLDLPTDKPRPAVQTFNGAGRSSFLAEDLTGRLRSLARREGATLFMVLLAAFKVLMARYSRQTVVTVGTPIANRNRVEIEGLIGFFVNTLVLRSDLSGDPMFCDLLAQVRETTLGAYLYQDLPFEKLVEELQPERSLSYSPLFQVLFALQNAPRDVMALPGIKATLLETQTETAKFDLTVALDETPEGLGFSVQYNTDLFEDSTAARLMRHYETLLREIAVDSEQVISRVPLVTDAERDMVLNQMNGTDRKFSGFLINVLFEGQTSRTPDRIAIIDGERWMTYAEADRQANRLGHRLRRLGVKQAAQVGVFLERRPEMVIALLATLKAGGAYVPIDPGYPKPYLAFVLDDAQAEVVVTQEKLRTGLPDTKAKVLCVDSERAEINRERASSVQAGAIEENLAYVIYTSGSTGRPKGVAIEHRSAAGFLHWAHETFSTEEMAGVLASTSICFDLSVFELFAPLTCGGTVVLAETVLDIALRQWNENLTLVNTVPSTMAELIRHGRLPSGVSVVNLAGEALKGDLVEQIYREPSVQRVLNLYGPSEGTTYSTFAIIERESTDLPRIGRPVANAQCYILEKEMEPAPIGVPGELHLAGAGLARGYFNRPDLTAKQFIPNPFSDEPGARMYATGDLARSDETGELHFLGRMDQQIKLRGYRVEAGEIEAILRQHGKVQDATVVAHRNDTRGIALAAYVVGKAEQVDSRELRAYLNERLPAYLIPNFFVTLDKLPMTPNGKVDRRGFSEPFAAGRPVKGEFIAPRTELEKIIAGGWREVLGVEKVGIDDNFFDLGGHSLLTIRLQSRLKQLLACDVPILHMFMYPTVGSLARHLASREPDLLEVGKVLDKAERQKQAFGRRKRVFKSKVKANG